MAHVSLACIIRIWISAGVGDDFSNFADTQTDRMGLPSPHSHWHSPEEIAIIEAAGKIPRNRERERRSADNARLPAAWPFQLHHCLPPPCHIFHSDKRGREGGAGLGQ